MYYWKTLYIYIYIYIYILGTSTIFHSIIYIYICILCRGGGRGGRGGAVAPSDLPKKNPIWYCTSHFDLKPFKVPYSKEQITLFCLCFIGFICLFKQNNVCGSHLKTKFLFFLLHVLNFLSDCNFFSLWCLCHTIISFELGYPHNHNNKK